MRQRQRICAYDHDCPLTWLIAYHICIKCEIERPKKLNNFCANQYLHIYIF